MVRRAPERPEYVVDDPLLLDELRQAKARLLELTRRRVRLWEYDPVRWVDDVIEFPSGEALTPYQADTLALVPEEERVAVRGPHGLGKTTTAALAVLWFATTRDLLGRDWKIPTTAGAWRQLEKYLWPEIHKWVRCIRWDVLGRKAFSRTELLDLALKLDYGEAFAVASSDPALIEGVHADAVLYVYDESKAIPTPVFDASEGAFAGASGVKGVIPEAFALAQSTPGDPEGRFYEIHSRRPGLEDWHPVHVTMEQAVEAGRISRTWVAARRRQWGEKSQLFANRVLGEFAGSEANQVIPLGWVEASIERWWAVQGSDLGVMTDLGVDVAREGDDETVFARKYGPVILSLDHHSFDDTTVTSAWAQAVLEANPQARAIVDSNGLGAGVFDQLRAELGPDRVEAFSAGEGTDWTDRSGELRFANKRAGAWWNLREMLDPAHAPVLALPPDDLLIGDLTAPRWKAQPKTGRIVIESKEEIKKRLGRSTDSGDAVVQSAWPRQRRARMTFAGRAA